jgi:hypothetical protein
MQLSAGATFSATRGSQEPLRYLTVAPKVVVEFLGATSVAHGRWRHSVPAHRIRTDILPDDVPPYAP